MKVITRDWMEELSDVPPSGPDVGCGGAASCYYAEQHHFSMRASLSGLGAHRAAGPQTHYKDDKMQSGLYGDVLCYAQDVTAVTGACLFWSAAPSTTRWAGLDEEFPGSLQRCGPSCPEAAPRGISECVLRLFAELYHYESKTRGMEEGEEAEALPAGGRTMFRRKWKADLDAGWIPYFNPNFSLELFGLLRLNNKLVFIRRNILSKKADHTEQHSGACQAFLGCVRGSISCYQNPGHEYHGCPNSGDSDADVRCVYLRGARSS